MTRNLVLRPRQSVSPAEIATGTDAVVRELRGSSTLTRSLVVPRIRKVPLVDCSPWHHHPPS